MRKAEIVQRIVQELGCTTAKANAALEGVLEAVKAALQQEEPFSCVAWARFVSTPSVPVWAEPEDRR